MTETDAVLDKFGTGTAVELEHGFVAKSGRHDRDRVTAVQCRHKLFMNYGPSVQEHKWAYIFVRVVYMYMHAFTWRVHAVQRPIEAAFLKVMFITSHTHNARRGRPFQDTHENREMIVKFLLWKVNPRSTWLRSKLSVCGEWMHAENANLASYPFDQPRIFYKGEYTSNSVVVINA